MNTGPLGMVAPLRKMRNYIFGGGPKRKKTEGDKAPDVVLAEPPKPRHDPEMHNYIFGGGPKRKKTEGDKAPDVVLPEPPKPRHDPEMHNYIWL